MRYQKQFFKQFYGKNGTTFLLTLYIFRDVRSLLFETANMALDLVYLFIFIERVFILTFNYLFL